MLSSSLQPLNMKPSCAAIVTTPWGMGKKCYLSFENVHPCTCFSILVFFSPRPNDPKSNFKKPWELIYSPGLSSQSSLSMEWDKSLTPVRAQREGRAKRPLTVVLFWPWFRWRPAPLFSCFIRSPLAASCERGYAVHKATHGLHSCSDCWGCQGAPLI